MADSQNGANEEIIDLTDLIAKGDKDVPAPDEPSPKDTAAGKAEENTTGTKLESLNDVAANSLEGDIDDLLAQMDADGKNEEAEPAAQPETPQKELEADADGHIVDPHEKLDMSGMEAVDSLLSALQIPLKPPAVEEGERQAAVPESDLSNEDTAPTEQPASAQTAPPEIRELSSELDEILATAYAPLSDDDPQRQDEMTDSVAVDSITSSQKADTPQTDPVQYALLNETSAQDTPDAGFLQDDILPDDAPPYAQFGLSTDFDAQRPSDVTPEQIPASLDRQREDALQFSPGEETASPDLLTERLQEIKDRQDRYAQEMESFEKRLTALESATPSADQKSETAGEKLTGKLDDLEQRLLALELPAKPAARENSASAEQAPQTIHAYMEIMARLDSLEERLNSVTAKFEERLDAVESRLDTALEQFEARVDKVAAVAVAKLLREEIAKLLTN